MKRNLLKKVLILTSLISICYGCHSNEYDDKVSVSNSEVTEDFKALDDNKSSTSSNKNKFKDLKIIKSAMVRYKVKDVKKATASIKQISNNFNAYISDLRLENNLYKKENRFILKVPATSFDIVMDSISNVAEFIDYENITTKDVTAEYIDIEARLKTKLEVKERYESILRNKAKNVEDLLDVEQKLQVIQEEIESSLGRLKYLTNKVSYSTIQIDLYETVEYKEEPSVYKKTLSSEVKEAFLAGWNFTKSILIGLIYVWPLLLIGVIVFILVRKRLRK